MDDLAHPSLVDAARFLDCPVLRFKTRDAEDLTRAVRRCGPEAKLIVLTDGMFAKDGSAAPLGEYLKVLPKAALLLVDDAHGAGVLGRTGQGALEHAGISRRRVIQIITLSKAFGVYGGAVLGTRTMRKRVLDRSHLFVGSTPLPLPLASAALRSLEILRADVSLRRRLMGNAGYVRASLRKAGFPLPETPGPIVPLAARRAADVPKLKRAFLNAGILPPFIKYPGGPANGYFRFVISSEHTRAQLDCILQVLFANLTRFTPAG